MRYEENWLNHPEALADLQSPAAHKRKGRAEARP